MPVLVFYAQAFCRHGAGLQKYGLPLFAAWDKCFHVSGSGRARNRKMVSQWPGSLRGHGAITREEEWSK
jgi:hypothetical protein